MCVNSYSYRGVRGWVTGFVAPVQIQWRPLMLTLLRMDTNFIFYDPDDDERYNPDHAKYDMAEDMADRIEASPDNEIYMVGYSAGADAVVLAIEMSGYAENLYGIGLIDPYLEYTVPGGGTGYLQSAANEIDPSGITIALADSPADKTTVSINGAVLPPKLGLDPFSYQHPEMGTKPDVFNFIFKAIVR
jgi:pimeloyl-ACP methyl ester carboxylesterase